MKKQIFIIAAVLFTAGSIIVSGCKKADTTPPVITLTGASSISQNITDTYTDPGFKATDDVDGDITSKVVVTGTVTNGSVNTYTLKYNVSDAAGNAATEQTRTVMVNSSQLAGTYSVTSVVTGAGAGTYGSSDQAVQSTIAYNKLNITNFGGLGAAVSVYVTISGTQITIPSQSPTGMVDPTDGVTPVTGTISGTGIVNGIDITSMNYSISYNTTPSQQSQSSDTWTNHQ